jgi:hypothetical protein
MINSVKPLVYLKSKLSSNSTLSKVIKAIILFVAGATKVQLSSEEKTLCLDIIADIKTSMSDDNIIINNDYCVERVLDISTQQYSIKITYMHDGKQCIESAISYSIVEIPEKLSRLSKLEERFNSNARSLFHHDHRANEENDILESVFEQSNEAYIEERYGKMASFNPKKVASSKKTTEEFENFVNTMLERDLIDKSEKLKDFDGGFASVKFKEDPISQVDFPNLEMLKKDPESLRVTLHYEGNTVIANCFCNGESYDKWGTIKLKDPVNRKYLQYVKNVKEFDEIYADILENSNKMYVLSGYDAIKFLNKQADLW